MAAVLAVLLGLLHSRGTPALAPTSVVPAGTTRSIAAGRQFDSGEARGTWSSSSSPRVAALSARPRTPARFASRDAPSSSRDDETASDVDLGPDGVADAEALSALERSARIALDRCPLVAFVAPRTELECLVAYAAGARRFVVPSVSAAAALSRALGTPADVSCVSRRPPAARDLKASQRGSSSSSSSSKKHAALPLCRADSAASFAPPRASLSKVSASRAKFLAAAAAAKHGTRPERQAAEGGDVASSSRSLLLVDFPSALVDDALRHARFGGLWLASARDAAAAIDVLRDVLAERRRPPARPLALALPYTQSSLDDAEVRAVLDEAAQFLDVFFVLDLEGPEAPRDDGVRADDLVDLDVDDDDDDLEEDGDDDDDLEDDGDDDLDVDMDDEDDDDDDGDLDDDIESLVAEVERLKALSRTATGT